jgi:hypothetical protein
MKPIVFLVLMVLAQGGPADLIPSLEHKDLGVGSKPGTLWPVSGPKPAPPFQLRKTAAEDEDAQVHEAAAKALSQVER